MGNHNPELTNTSQQEHDAKRQHLAGLNIGSLRLLDSITKKPEQLRIFVAPDHCADMRALAGQEPPSYDEPAPVHDLEARRKSRQDG